MALRCHECGSWREQCGSDSPVAECGCARCAVAARDAARQEVAEVMADYLDLGAKLADALRERDEADAEVDALRVALAKVPRTSCPCSPGECRGCWVAAIEAALGQP